MAGRTGDRHAKDQINVRFPPDVLARLKADAKRHGQAQSDIVVRGTVTELDRLAELADDAYVREHGGDDLDTGHLRDPEGDEAAHG
jgi:hypothetical protein